MQAINNTRTITFRELFDKMFPSICSFLTSYTKDHDISMDLAQDVFLKVYENWNKIKSIEHKSYVYTMARNIAYDYLKHNKIVKKNEIIHYELYSTDFFLHEVTKQETIASLRLSIDKLPNQSRNIIILCLRGFTNPEIADHLGISVNSVKTLKKLAYSKLKAQLPYCYIIILASLLHV